MIHSEEWGGEGKPCQASKSFEVSVFEKIYLYYMYI